MRAETKTITTTTYYAEDGSGFETPKECNDYEVRCLSDAVVETEFAGTWYLVSSHERLFKLAKYILDQEIVEADEIEDYKGELGWITFRTEVDWRGPDYQRKVLVMLSKSQLLDDPIKKIKDAELLLKSRFTSPTGY